MKKLTAMLLALCMVFTLAACKADTPGNSQQTPSGNGGSDGKEEIVTVLGDYDVTVANNNGATTYNGKTVDELKSAKPKEYIPEKLAAGVDVSLAFLCVNLQSIMIAKTSAGIEEICKANGINYYVQEMNMDVATQLDCIENFLTMGVSVIVTFCIDENATADTAAKVMDSGTALVILDGTPSFPTSLTIATSPYDIGYQEGKMISAWVDQTYPEAGDGAVKAALMNNVIIPDFVKQNDGLMAALGEDSRIQLVYEQAGSTHTLDEGYTFAEDALTSDPDITLFITKTGSQGIGVNNYLQSAGLAGDSYGVFSSDCDEEGRAMVDASVDSSASVLRGLIGYGTYNRQEGMMDLVFKLLKGEIEEGLVTSEGIYCYNSFGYDYDERG